MFFRFLIGGLTAIIGQLFACVAFPPDKVYPPVYEYKEGKIILIQDKEQIYKIFERP